jgi:hypothetical protein
MRDHKLAGQEMVMEEKAVFPRVIGIVLMVVKEGPLPDP